MLNIVYLKEEDPIIRILPRERYFNILNNVHKDCRPVGRDKMVNCVKSRYYIGKKTAKEILAEKE